MNKTSRRAQRRGSKRGRVRGFDSSRGITQLEVVLSTALLIAVMGATATIFHKVNLVWKDIRHHRIATGELANQLDVLTRIPAGKLETAIDDLQPSEICSNALPKPTLSANVVKDALGDRLDLEIEWRSGNGSRKNSQANRARLSGWLMEGASK